jgi:nucleoid DNA-binding protein
MENYILQILESSTRVIVPEFGAFIVKQRNPLTVVFNEFLQYNDGVMVDVVAKSEGISREDAKLKIDEYVKGINNALSQGESYAVGKLGVIVKGGLGKISLEKEDIAKKPAKKSPEKTVETEKPQKKVPIAKKKPEVQPEVTKELKPSVEKELTTVKDNEINEKKEPVKEKDEVVSENAAPIAEKAVSQPVTEERNQPEKKQEKIHLTEAKPAYSAASKTSEPEISTKKRFSRSSIIAWVVIILAINVLLLGYFIYSDELKGIFSMNNKDTTTTAPLVVEDIPEAQTDTIEPALIEESPVISEEAIPETVNQKELTPASVRYYIVAGVFRDENNAVKLVNELKQKGYNAEKFGRIGNLHAVSYDDFATKAEADQFLIKVQKEIDPEAWIRKVN